MLNYRRAIAFAVLLIAIIFLVKSSHTTQHLQAPFRAAASTGGKGSGSQKGSTQDNDSKSSSSDGTLSGLSRQSTFGTSEAQRPLPDFSALPLRQRLAYHFPYKPDRKFPAFIWQTWRDDPGSGSFPQDLRPLEASWTEAHPNFVHEVITDDAAVHVLQHLYSATPDVLEAYNSLPRAVLKADFFRYLILLARGGIYSDIDTGVLKPIQDWVPEQIPRNTYGLVIGIEADPDREDWADWYSRRIQFCQWTIQAKPGHPVLNEIVAKITEETLKRKTDGGISKDDVNEVVNLTGPAIWTDTIFDFFNNPVYYDIAESPKNITWRDFTGMERAKRVGDVIVLPITSFSPGVEQMGSKGVDDPMAFVQHLFIGSWKPESERVLGN